MILYVMPFLILYNLFYFEIFKFFAWSRLSWLPKKWARPNVPGAFTSYGQAPNRHSRRPTRLPLKLLRGWCRPSRYVPAEKRASALRP